MNWRRKFATGCFLQRETSAFFGEIRQPVQPKRLLLNFCRLQHSKASLLTLCSIGPVVIDHSGLIDKKHTDSTLVVGTSILSVHKAIISARNDQILQGVAPKKNKKGGFDYDLKDVEFPIMRIVVQWLYSGT